MKRGYSIILAASTAILLVTTGQPSFGDSAPTTDEIVRALRPVPSALQSGHQGLPTIGAPVRPEANPNYTNASTTGTVVHADTRAGRTAAPPRSGSSWFGRWAFRPSAWPASARRFASRLIRRTPTGPKTAGWSSSIKPASAIPSAFLLTDQIWPGLSRPCLLGFAGLSSRRCPDAVPDQHKGGPVIGVRDLDWRHDRVGHRRAADLQPAIEAGGGENAAGPAIAVAVIAAQPEPVAIEEGIRIDLPENLLVVEGAEQEGLHALAEIGVGVGRSGGQDFRRPCSLRAPVVEIEQTAYFLARQLGDQRHRAGLPALAPQDRPGGHAGNIVGKQQIAFEIGVLHRAFGGQALQHVENQLPRRTDIAVKLDLADVAFDRADHKNDLVARLLEFAANERQDITVVAIAGLQVLGDFVEPRPRHRGADHIGIEGAQACLVVNGDALDANLIDPHRRAGRRRWRGLSGRRGRRHDLRLGGGQDARDRGRDQRGHRGGSAW